ncbi:MAG TPA: hypothetical protein VMG58_09425, partial [Candidatus Sulfotelmatobacter sp.]|nr:hypothetical protein [Candidatus Sulfotelmatobacter sp.]
MSYILDALRKADQEREQQRLGVPTITTMHFVREGMKRRGLLMLLLSGCAVAGLVIWLAWPSSVPVSPVVPRP